MTSQSQFLEMKFAAALTTFLQGWGPIDWGDVARLPASTASPDGEIFWALANIEDDSVFMRRKLAIAGLVKSPSIHDFNVVWLAEEAEHGRALLQMAKRREWQANRTRHDVAHRDIRSGFANIALFGARVSPTNILASYLVLGTVQEYVALSTYAACVRLLNVAEQERIVLHNIARQEGRHMRFYRSCAQAVLKTEPKAGRFVNVALDMLWRPPGVDLLGEERWRRIFRLFLADRWMANRIRNVDELLLTQFGLRTRVGSKWMHGSRAVAASI